MNSRRALCGILLLVAPKSWGEQKAHALIGVGVESGVMGGSLEVGGRAALEWAVPLGRFEYRVGAGVLGGALVMQIPTPKTMLQREPWYSFALGVAMLQTGFHFAVSPAFAVGLKARFGIGVAEEEEWGDGVGFGRTWVRHVEPFLVLGAELSGTLWRFSRGSLRVFVAATFLDQLSPTGYRIPNLEENGWPALTGGLCLDFEDLSPGPLPQDTP